MYVGNNIMGSHFSILNNYLPFPSIEKSNEIFRFGLNTDPKD